MQLNMALSYNGSMETSGILDMADLQARQQDGALIFLATSGVNPDRAWPDPLAPCPWYLIIRLFSKFLAVHVRNIP